MSRDVTPISFKTVPGRNKTQKWTKAPAVDYGGDEWGGYDDYDYDDEDRNPPPPPPPSIPGSQAPRDPYASSSGLARKNSFDQGDETRAFSSSTHPATDPHTHQEDVPQHHTPGRSPARDFTNPEQVPAPLSMRNSPTPVQGERWPGRKESMSSKGTPPMAPASSTTTEKPLPFIRPSDIYKRIPDEIRRQSEDGPRPSMDSIGSGSGARERIGLGLEPVAENRESRLFLDGADTHSAALRGKSTSPRLPDVTRFSGFGDDFLSGNLRGGSTSTHSPEAVIARVANAPFTTTSSTTSPSSIQHTPITRAPPGQDPAAEILSERQHDTSVETIAGEQPASLQHQPSAGFRSAVHTAFDRNDSSISRDNSQGSVDVHRSDTSPTAGISPIINRGPQFPSIAEETSSNAGQSLRGQSPDSRVSRKPSPGGTGGVDFVPGYRRSLDPPSTGTSPARTPAVESVETRRLSTPMSAVPMDAEAPDVVDQAAEMPTATLHPMETPARGEGQLPRLDASSSTTAAIPITGRGRSNTDYSLREADIAQTINSASPEQGDDVSGLIKAQRDSQKIFLQTHIEKQPASPISPGGGFREGASGSRAGSPTKGRVREIADQYHGMNEAARRNSAVSISSSSKALSTKSSWSNFDDTEKKLARQGTGEGEIFPAYENADLSPVRPGVSREESFRPNLPGGWISSAPTPEPGTGPAYPLNPQQTKATLSDEDELTPTTRKVRLQEALTHQPSPAIASKPPNALDQVKNAGSELGAALMASVGVSHQTRDFGSAAPAAPVDEREVEKPTRGMQPPTLFRHETDSDAPSSVASTMPPSPPAKDSPKISETLGNGYFSTVAPLRVKSREESPIPERSAAQERGLSLPRPGVTTALSMEPGAEDEESDRLRKEIVRSLDPLRPVEDARPTQDALDAPDNQRQVASGQTALQSAESRQPALLQTRFSWEKPTTMSEEADPLSPEIKPEMAYERPRSKALHVVNPNEIDSPATETPVTRAAPIETLRPNTFGTPVAEKQEEGLLPDTDVQPGSPSQSLKEIPPSPTSEPKSSRDVNRQSYYASDSSQAAAPTGSTIILPGQNGLATSSISSARATGPAKPIPPFRNILALKTGDERIKSYNETRTTFANMNTGLGDWVGSMLALHPELASNATTSTGAWKAPPLQTTGSGIAGTFLKGHKASPSLAKFTNKFGESGRSTSIGSAADDSSSPNTAAGGGGANILRPTTSNTTGPSGSTTGLPAFDTDKMQQKGKAFMAKTGVLGGKAQAGAKGLFAKGKSRFASGGSAGGAGGRSVSGNEKVIGTSPPSAPSTSAVPLSNTTKSSRNLEEARGESETVGLAVSSPVEVREDAVLAMASTAVDVVPIIQPTTQNVETTFGSSSTGEGRMTGGVVDLPPTSGASGAGDGGLSTATAGGAEVSGDEALISPLGNVADAEKLDGVALSPSRDVRGESSWEETARDTNEEVIGGKDVENTASPMSSTGGDNHASDLLTEKSVEEQDGVHDASSPNSAAEVASPGSRTDQAFEQHHSLAQISTTPELSTAPTMMSTSLTRSSTAVPITAEPTATPLPETSTPISAIGPRFPRHASSKSASPFRSNSPFQRDASQTPGSDRKSRPLSMIWSDWLREKTRSKSRGSGGGESRSRPASMMLPDTSSKDTPDFVLGDLSDVAVYSTSPTAPINIPTRTETWNDPDAVLPPRTPETRELVLERLGVLPSPAPTAATSGESPGNESRRRRRSSAARMNSGGGEGLGLLELETVDSGESVGGATSPVKSPPVLRKVSEAEEIAVVRPGQKRRASDLEMLPSELKRLSLGQGIPRPDSSILKQSQVDLLAGTGPVAREGGLGDGIDDDAVLEASVINSPHLVMDRSRRSTGNAPGQGVADTWDDARSEVSAEDGAADEVPHASTNPGTSRHSSVSSLGAPDTAPPASQGVGEESATSTQFAPAGPAPAALFPLAATVGDVPSVGQQIQQRPGLTDRALSYMPLPRDEDGLPIPETITTGSLHQVDTAPLLQQIDTTSAPLQQIDTTSAPVQQTMMTASLQPTNTLSSNEISPVAADLGAMSGPPLGTPPFQKHPVFRNRVVQPETSSDVPTAATDGGANSQSTTADAEALQKKRRSGFFRKSQLGGAALFTDAPPPNRINDNHGLEDLQPSDDEAVPDLERKSRNTQPVDKQNKRRSGLWDVLTTKRASSGAKLDMGGDLTAIPSEPSAKAREEIAQRKLQKPQRASTSAVAAEPKKKRFSALGSMFGRSETSRQAAIPKTNKLTKMAPSSGENIRRTESPREGRPGNDSTVSGNVGSYEEYEAKRKREAAAYQKTMVNARPRVASGAQGQSARPTDTASAQPPPEGWYGPSDTQRPLQQPTLPAVDSQPGYRRLHSQGRPVSQLPQAFRPVEASFNAPVAPVGPPPDPRIVQDPRTTAIHSPGYGRRFSFDRRNSYGSAYASEFSGFSGQQVAGQMLQSPPSQSSSGPDVSPIMTRTDPPTGQALRVVSRGTEEARSPANDYSDQQTPWAITIPPGQGSTRTSRASSWDMSRDGTQYPGPPPGAPYHQYQQYPPQSGYTGPYFPPSQEYGQPSYLYDNGPHASQYSYQEPYQQQYSHAPLLLQQQQPYSYPQDQQQSYRPQQPRPQSRYYSQQQQQQHISTQQQIPPQSVYQQSTGPEQQQQQYDSRMQHQRHHRRRSSGYSGRRDDMTAGEEELVMRGVSYPGQEWQPPGLGRSGWD